MLGYVFLLCKKVESADSVISDFVVIMAITIISLKVILDNSP
jgi:hypothetical protein